MFTLIYNNEQFNRPDTLVPFLQSNVGKDALIQIGWEISEERNLYYKECHKGNNALYENRLIPAGL